MNQGTIDGKKYVFDSQGFWLLSDWFVYSSYARDLAWKKKAFRALPSVQKDEADVALRVYLHCIQPEKRMASLNADILRDK